VGKSLRIRKRKALARKRDIQLQAEGKLHRTEVCLAAALQKRNHHGLNCMPPVDLDQERMTETRPRGEDFVGNGLAPVRTLGPTAIEREFLIPREALSQESPPRSVSYGRNKSSQCREVLISLIKWNP
jgi:hypothetical protein